MFVDEIKIKLIAGKGGDGCSSFRREKYVPMGGPDGGNGGRGSNIIFKVDRNLTTLFDLKYQKIIKGKKGENGKGSNRHGKNAEDLIIKVPAGTTVINVESEKIMVDLINDGEEFIVAHGGRGGHGNKFYATHSNPAPKICELGEPGEEVFVRLELKVLADVGLVGFPSVGKSTLLSVISASKPKIAAYHFTTLSPNLGVVKLKDHRRFVMADLPGLIEGAADGAGLGHQFLKHTKRTKVIAHVIDMAGTDYRDPLEDYEKINAELSKYSEKLAAKRQVVIANKMDLNNALANLEKFKKKYPQIDVCEISAINSQGIDECLQKIADVLEVVKNEKNQNNIEQDEVVFKYEKENPFTITKEDGIWIVEGKEIEKLFKMTRFDLDEAVVRFGRKLRGMGVEEELEKLGAKKGDEISICDNIFVFKE